MSVHVCESNMTMVFSTEEDSNNEFYSLNLPKRFKRLALEWASGGVANALTSSLLNPMDVSKTRMQVESMRAASNTQLLNNILTDVTSTTTSTSSSSSSTPSLRRTLLGLYQEGGIVGLWRPGLKASIGRELLYSGPRAGFYVPVRNALNQVILSPDEPHSPELASNKNSPLVVKIMAAMVTGSLGALIANPIDVIKVRQMTAATFANTQPRNFLIGSQQPTTLTGEFTSIIRQKGVGALYAGLLPSVFRGALVTAGGIATYDQTKSTIREQLGIVEGALLHTIASLITGLVATTVAAPLDVIKTRTMHSAGSSTTAAVQQRKLHMQLLMEVQTVYTQHGLKGFLRGWVPAYLRLGPHSLICYPVFEQTRRMLGLDYI